MGSNLGKFISARITRPIKNFNLESRAHKEISKDKPLPAPMHKSSELQLEKMMKDYPEVYEESLKKNIHLDENLKKVFVKSFDVVKEQKQNPEKPLPLDRRAVEDYEYGAKEPEKIPLGKVTLRQALQFITDHQTSPKLETSEKISNDYKVPEGTIKNILHYFKVMELYVPEGKQSKGKFAGPGVTRIKLVERERKRLEASDKM